MATKLECPNERHYTMCGTPNFISPEVASREAHGLETDVWSLGCMMYTFLTGRPPFDAHGRPFETLDKVRLGEFVMPKHISAEAQDLLRGLLQKDPVKRIRLIDVPSHPFMVNSKSEHMMLSGGGGNLGVNGGSVPGVVMTPVVSAGMPVVLNNNSNSASLTHSHGTSGGGGGMMMMHMMRSTTPTPRQPIMSSTTPIANYSSSSSSLTKVL